MRRGLCVLLATFLLLGLVSPALAAEEQAEVVPFRTAPMIGGSWHTATALKSDGTVWAVTMDQDHAHFAAPMQVQNLNNVISVAGGAALRADGTVWAWRVCCCTGDLPTRPVQISNLNNVIAIADGVALRNDGTVWDWCLWNERNAATRIPNLSNVTAIAEDTALRNDGTVWTWSADGMPCESFEPFEAAQVPNLSNVTAITEGAALSSNGTVRMWNTLRSWTFYDDGFNTRQAAGLSNITAIAGGTALRADGTVWQFRLGKFMDSPMDWETEQLLPAARVPNVGNAAAIASGIALDRNGYVWGWNPVLVGQEGWVGHPSARIPGPGGVGFLNLMPRLFEDVPGTHWAMTNGAIPFVYANNIMGGTAGNFAPNGSFSRAMVVATLYRMVYGPATQFPYAQNRPIFNDVPVTNWASHYIAWAYDNGIGQGSGGNFSPGNPVTREQFAAMLYRFAEFREHDTAVRQGAQWGNFPDRGQIGGWAVDYLMWANYHELITGVTAGANVTISPRGTTNRAQAATILMRFVQTFEE